MSITAQIVLIILIESVFEALTWGTVGFFVFRYFRFDKYKWYWECAMLLIPLLAYAYLIGSTFIALDISFGNEEVRELIGNSLNSYLGIDRYTVLFAVVEVFLGYRLGEILLRKFQARIAPAV